MAFDLFRQISPPFNIFQKKNYKKLEKEKKNSK